MLKTTYLENRSIGEKELNFKEFSTKVEEYFLLSDNGIKNVNIRIENSLSNGIAMTFNNHIELKEGLYKCFKVLNNETLLIEFKEFNQCFTINSDANITIDFIHNRIFLCDFNITIYFNK
ncbi:TPA: hypothetical protein ACF2DE_002969 [Clostridium perfringens]